MGREKARGAWKGICAPPPPRSILAPSTPAVSSVSGCSSARVSSNLLSILVRKDLAFTREAAVTQTPFGLCKF